MTDDLAAPLNDLRIAIDHAQATQAHEDVLSVLEAISHTQEHGKDVEGSHIGEALSKQVANIESAQAEVREFRIRLAGLALLAQEALYELLSSDNRRALSRTALTELSAPVVDAELLGRLRSGRAAVEARRASA